VPLGTGDAPYYEERRCLMLYYVALASFVAALVLGALNFVGVTPGAAGAVSLALLMAVVLLGAQSVLNFSQLHPRRHAHR
jgi:hypothetical protein